MNYEQQLEKLEQLTRELEKDIPLSVALEKYNESVKIIKDCVVSLDEVKGSISKIRQDLDAFIEEKMR